MKNGFLTTDSGFVNLLYQLLFPVALNNWCEVVGWGPLVLLGAPILSVIALLS